MLVSYNRPEIGLSDLSVTEFLTLSRAGFLPHGLVIGSAIFDCGYVTTTGTTSELKQLGHAMRAARVKAVERMCQQALKHDAEGVVGVRLQVERHKWRGAHQVVKFIALGTAVAFDHEHGPEEFKHAPSLRLANGQPFTSDLAGQDFVTLLRAGYRPVSLALGNCVYEVNPDVAGGYAMSWRNEEIPQYTQAFFDAREEAMERLTQDLFRHHPAGHADAPVGVVGMTVDEQVHGDARVGEPCIVEYTAVGTAVAPLAEGDPRRAPKLPEPYIAVPLDR